MLPKIIIDTDIGDDIDDSFALILAVLSRKMDIIGVTTCFRDSFKRAKIAKALLEAVGCKIEVYAGENQPHNQEMVYADFDKFDKEGNVIIPYYFEEMETYNVNEIHAVDFIIDSLEKYPNEITIVSIGPLTNLAEVIDRDPNIFSKVKSILFMGGQTESPFKEWNVRCDVEAAVKVYSANVPMKTVGLNVTSQCGLDYNKVDYIMSLDDIGYRPLLKKMLKAYIDFFDGRRMPIMHDVLTIACLIENYCEFKNCKVDVVADGEERGRTIINPLSSNLEIEVASEVNVDKFMDYLFTILEENSTLT